MIREAKLEDVPALKLIVQGLIARTDLRANSAAIGEMLIDAISSRKHLVLISAGSDGCVVGLMLTSTGRIGWAEKMCGNIDCIYSPIPGDSKAMLDATMAWVKGRRAIQMVSYTAPVPSKVDRLLLLNGFESTGSMILWRRYNGSI